MGLVLMLNKPGDKFSRMFERGYYCTNCFHKVAPFEDSWPLVYHCEHCNRTACNPRVCYRLREGYKDIAEIGNLLDDLHFWDNTLYHGRLATYIKAMHSFFQGGDGIAGRVDSYSLENY